MSLDYCKLRYFGALNVINNLLQIQTILQQSSANFQLVLKNFRFSDHKILNVKISLFTVNACHGKFSCVWCKCSKEQRHQVDYEWSISDPTKGARSIAENIEMAAKSAAKKSKNPAATFGVINQPLFEFIPLDRVVPDPLHAFLRISDQLFEQLISLVRKHDNIEAASASSSAGQIPEGSRLNQLQNDIRSLGITCKISTADGKLSLSSLPRPQRMRIFEKLNLQRHIGHDHKYAAFAKVWTDFLDLEKYWHSNQNEASSVDYETLAKDWIRLFGTEVCLTSEHGLYCHTISAHFGQFMKKYQRLSLFMQETWEKMNDELTSAYFRASNHRGADGLKQVIEKVGRRAILKDNSVPQKKKLFKVAVPESTIFLPNFFGFRKNCFQFIFKPVRT